jgi:hypothetical protein
MSRAEGSVKLIYQYQLRGSGVMGIPGNKAGPEVDALPGPGGSFLKKF